MLQKNIAELEKLAKGAGGGEWIKFIVTQASAAIAPSSYLDRCMLYSYLIMFTFGAYVTWLVFTAVARNVLGGYVEALYCLMALGVPTFAMTLPVYRFKHRNRARLCYKQGAAR
jgi:hypothetical protein